MIVLKVLVGIWLGAPAIIFLIHALAAKTGYNQDPEAQRMWGAFLAVGALFAAGTVLAELLMAGL